MTRFLTVETEALSHVLSTALPVFMRGGLVAIPTETVYGLAADATNGAAVARIYEVKGRPAFNPLIVHCASLEMAKRYGVFSKEAEALARAFWPGPLTLVLPYRSQIDQTGAGIASLVRAGLSTIALRVPAGVSATIIKNLDRPLAAPSANQSGRLSPTLASHVRDQLGGKIDLIIDAGACPIGVESTIVSFADGGPLLLRPGGISAEALEKYFGHPLRRATGDMPVAAPGMLASHYAPQGILRLNAMKIEGREDGAINFGASDLSALHTVSLSKTGDLREAAANLFAALALLDAKGVRAIAVAPVPETGLGAAINDRLRRAAAPRPT